jgi:hypothetical protein
MGLARFADAGQVPWGCAVWEDPACASSLILTRPGVIQNQRGCARAVEFSYLHTGAQHAAPVRVPYSEYISAEFSGSSFAISVLVHNAERRLRS